MKKDLTWIVYVLDESGSMGPIKSDTIGAFNTFIEEQRTVEGEAKCSLVKFNTQINKIYENVSIEETPLLTIDGYKPNSMTRLYDAIGETIKETKKAIKALNDDSKPEKVLFVILTDGEENFSKMFDQKTVFEKIAKREGKGWKFIYLGANQDAMKEGGKIGISGKSSATWTADSGGVKRAFYAASSFATKYRNAETTADYNALDLNQELENANKKEI